MLSVRKSIYRCYLDILLHTNKSFFENIICCSHDEEFPVASEGEGAKKVEAFLRFDSYSQLGVR